MTYVEFYTDLRDRARERIVTYEADPETCPSDIETRHRDRVAACVARELSLIAAYTVAIGDCA
jgi:hypothetical protein